MIFDFIAKSGIRQRQWLYKQKRLARESESLTARCNYPKQWTSEEQPLGDFGALANQVLAVVEDEYCRPALKIVDKTLLYAPDRFFSQTERRAYRCQHVVS